MKDLLAIKEWIFNDSNENYDFITRNKETGWEGYASFCTNGEDKILVFEGDPSGCDDASYTYDEFLKKYDFKLKKEGV